MHAVSASLTRPRWKMETLSLDQDRYNEGYAILLEKMGRRQRCREWAHEVFPVAIVQKFPSDQGDGDGTFRTLGIGSGNGEFELHLLKQLSTRFPRINHVVIEPSKEYVKAYQTEVATSSFQGSIHFEWHEGTFQEYNKKKLEGASSDGKFDFISAIHSLYYAENASETVELLYRSLAPGGILMIEMSDDKTSGQRMFEDFPELQQMFTLNKWVTFSDVTGALCNMSIPFSCLTNPVLFDITQIFDETSREGNLLLDFFTHVSNFRKTADDGLVQRVLKFLKIRAEEQTMVVPLEQASQTKGNVDDRKESAGLKFKKIWETLIIEKH